MKICGTQSQWIQQHNSYTQVSGTTGERKQEGCRPKRTGHLPWDCLLEMSEDAFMLLATLGANCMVNLLAMGDRAWVSLAGPSPKDCYILPPWSLMPWKDDLVFDPTLWPTLCPRLTKPQLKLPRAISQTPHKAPSHRNLHHWCSPLPTGAHHTDGSLRPSLRIHPKAACLTEQWPALPAFFLLVLDSL